MSETFEDNTKTLSAADKNADNIKTSSNTKRIAKNTLMLYFRQILIMLVSLYTVRVVLNVLGAEDYGIYNVVAGVVTMFSFLSGAMATASQRYFSFDLGKGDNDHLKTTFSVTFQIYVLLAAVVILLAETVGLWFVNHKLVIPAERMVAANWIFQAAIVSFLLTLITTPYMASIIAHENMNVYAYVSIIEAGLKLGIVFLLKILPYDKLIVYGLLLATVALINTSIYRLYCHKHYEECKFRFVKDGKLFKEIVSYSGWNLFGASVGVVKNQIINILLNMFFGAVVNAARAVALQVSYAVSTFANNFCTALKPQVIKKYAVDDKDDCYYFVISGCKFSFYLMYIFVLPLLFVTDIVLNLWLKNYPEYTILFTRLVLIDVLIDSFNSLIMTLVHASGRIKLYQSVVGGIQLLNLPVSLFVLKSGGESYYVFIVSIILTICAAIARLIIAKINTGFPIGRFLKNAFLPVFLVSVTTSLLSILIDTVIPSSYLGTFFFIVICVISSLFFIFLLGFSRLEKLRIFEFVKRKLKK